MKNFQLLILLISICFSAICFSPALAQVDQRKVDQEKVEELKKDDDFSYAASYEVPSDPFSMILAYIANFFKNIFLGSSIGNLFLLVIMIILFVFLIVYAIIKIFDLDKNFSLYRNKRTNGNSLENENIDDIQAIDFPTIIKTAYKKGDFREVVRNYYLYTLNRLDHKGVIRWKKGKTNYEYLYEVSDTTLQDRFSSLNHYFEYAIYGEFEVSESLAKSSEDLFNEINKSIG